MNYKSTIIEEYFPNKTKPFLFDNQIECSCFNPQKFNERVSTILDFDENFENIDLFIAFYNFIVVLEPAMFLTPTPIDLFSILNYDFFNHIIKFLSVNNSQIQDSVLNVIDRLIFIFSVSEEFFSLIKNTQFLLFIPELKKIDILLPSIMKIASKFYLFDSSKEIGIQIMKPNEISVIYNRFLNKDFTIPNSNTIPKRFSEDLSFSLSLLSYTSSSYLTKICFQDLQIPLHMLKVSDIEITRYNSVLALDSLLQKSDLFVCNLLQEEDFMTEIATMIFSIENQNLIHSFSGLLRTCFMKNFDFSLFSIFNLFGLCNHCNDTDSLVQYIWLIGNLFVCTFEDLSNENIFQVYQNFFIFFKSDNFCVQKISAQTIIQIIHAAYEYFDKKMLVENDVFQVFSSCFDLPNSNSYQLCFTLILWFIDDAEKNNWIDFYVFPCTLR